MGRNQSHIEAPWCIAVCGLFDPLDGAFRNGGVIFGVLAFARTDIAAQHTGIGGDAFILFPNGCPNHTDATNNHHRNMFNIESCGVFFAAIMQFSDRLDRDVIALQCVTPAWQLARIGHCVVPQARFMHMFTCCKGRTGRHTNRTGCVSLAKACSARGKAIQIRCFYKIMTCTSHGAALVFI